MTLSFVQNLRTRRQMRGRPSDLEEMTVDQLLEEKVDLRSALDQFERLFPAAAFASSDVISCSVKELKDRYRSVKRFIRRSTTVRIYASIYENYFTSRV